MAHENGLLPAYLANGDDALKRERVAERLEQRVGQLGDIVFNSDAFDGEGARGADIVASCNTLPFMSEVRLVVVKNADKLKKVDSEALVAYLGAPAPTTVLALYANGLAKNTRLYKAVAALGKQAVIDCSSVGKRDLPALVVQMAKGHGLRLRSDAAGVLIELAGEDTVRLDVELRKLALAVPGGQVVRPEDVERLVGRTTEPKPWEFVDALAERDAAKCVRLRALMASASPYALMSMSIERIRELAMTKGMLARGQESQLASAIKAPKWKVERYYPGYSRNYTADELRRALKTARDAERVMKSTSNADGAFDRWYLSVLDRHGASSYRRP